MANNFFYYPDATTPTTTLEFNTKGHLLDGSDETVEFNQITRRSKGGTRYATSFGASKQLWQFGAIVRESSESLADRADVISFLDTVLGAVEYFTWRDESEVDRVVRIIDTAVKFRKLSGDLVRCEMTLEVQ